MCACLLHLEFPKIILKPTMVWEILVWVGFFFCCYSKYALEAKEEDQLYPFKHLDV